MALVFSWVCIRFTLCHDKHSFKFHKQFIDFCFPAS